ncbi:hypothetical protein CCO03_16350 [Comamonas serinivorans]|uniref:Uncharacterized protein n=1 Tax=Comamonas serinivorans TaxID=1082851 RepID=A0A1Y0ERT9_9BURK|nr:DUF4034 domain-containing protein [Comamonas serinivorans]ARU06029.1 hypothetical protein CCO03_16350 [Comamonas serinivorans]
MRDAFNQQHTQICNSQSAAYRERRFADVEAQLTALLDAAHDDSERNCAWAELAGHHHVTALLTKDPAANQRALNALQTCVAPCPEDALNWLRLTEHFHYVSQDLNEAAQCVETTLAKALQEGNFVRQTLGARIRIALKRQDWGHSAAIAESLAEP